MLKVIGFLLVFSQGAHAALECFQTDPDTKQIQVAYHSHDILVFQWPKGTNAQGFIGIKGAHSNYQAFDTATCKETSPSSSWCRFGEDGLNGTIVFTGAKAKISIDKGVLATDQDDDGNEIIHAVRADRGFNYDLVPADSTLCASFHALPEDQSDLGDLVEPEKTIPAPSTTLR